MVHELKSRYGVLVVSPQRIQIIRYESEYVGKTTFQGATLWSCVNTPILKSTAYRTLARLVAEERIEMEKMK